MKTVFKYVMSPFPGEEILYLPQGAQLLTVQEQKANSQVAGQLVLWAAVETDAPTAPIRFWKQETGNLAPEDLGRYLTTVQMHTYSDWIYVLHIFVLDYLGPVC